MTCHTKLSPVKRTAPTRPAFCLKREIYHNAATPRALRQYLQAVSPGNNGTKTMANIWSVKRGSFARCLVNQRERMTDGRAVRAEVLIPGQTVSRHTLFFVCFFPAPSHHALLHLIHEACRPTDTTMVLFGPPRQHTRAEPR